MASQARGCTHLCSDVAQLLYRVLRVLQEALPSHLTLSAYCRRPSELGPRGVLAASRQRPDARGRRARANKK